MTSQPAFETKIAMIVRDDLATWQKLNLTPTARSTRRCSANR